MPNAASPPAIAADAAAISGSAAAIPVGVAGGGPMRANLPAAAGGGVVPVVPVGRSGGDFRDAHAAGDR
jgi:hypothetical protein